jgi:hypothetical protein
MDPAAYARWADIGRTQVFSASSLTNLIKNIATVAIVKHRALLGGLPPMEWEQRMSQRAGNEPIVRLMYVIFKDMNAAEIRLDEVMAYSPPDYIHFFEENQIAPYYEMFPFAALPPQ